MGKTRIDKDKSGVHISYLFKTIESKIIHIPLPLTVIIIGNSPLK